jgi:hypothetical protein
MKWERLLEKYGWKQADGGGDPFDRLCMGVQSARAGNHAVAKVSQTVGVSLDYGQVKVSCTVTVECPQSDAYISVASEAAFLKALEQVNEGAETLGIPKLPEVAT